jgi:peptide/nickel transport system permease protein
VARDETPLRRIFADFFTSPGAVVALALLCVIVGVAFAAPLISPQNPYDLAQLDLRDGKLPPGAVASGGGTFWLGSDARGRDLVSAILYGLRISLAVGVLSTIVALSLGLALGLTAACGGRVGSLIRRIADLELSFPAILIAVILLVVLGQGLGNVIAALVAVQWAYYARTVGDAALVEKRKEYIEAARGLALASPRIVFRHLLPNCLRPLLVVVTVQLAAAVMMEATLSFLGLGLPATEPSLGLLIADGYPYLLSGKYWMSFFPGIALLLTLASMHLVADRLRDVLDPRLQP